RGVKGLPCSPSAVPTLFLGPALRFQKMKIGRRVRPFAKMTGGKERIINPTVLHLRTIKFVTNGIVVVRGLEALFRILKREIRGDSRQRHRLTGSLGQFVAGAQSILAGFVFRPAKPGLNKPICVLFNGSGNLLGVTAFGPKREEREFFCFTERT